MWFRQLFDQDTSTYTYLLADEASREAVIIDPVLEQLDRDATLIDELELKLVAALDTHVHADHVTALGALKRRFGAQTVMSERGGAVCADRLVKQADRIVFGGHDHAYERIKPKDGVLYIVSGNGGARLYEHKNPHAYTDFFYNKKHGFTEVTVDGPRLTLRHVNADGEQVDRHVVEKGGRLADR